MRLKRYFWCYASVALFALLLASPTRAQNAAPPARAEGISAFEAAELAPAAFKTWAETEAKEVGRRNEAPLKLAQAVVARLNKGLMVSDETALLAASRWLNYEENKTATRVGAKTGTSIEETDYKNTVLLADTLLPLLEGRPVLQSQLHEIKAHVFNVSRNGEGEGGEHKIILNLLDPLHIKIDLQRMKSTMAKADALRAAGDSESADYLYVKVFSYTYELFPDAFIREQFLELDIEAAGALINIRKGNLKKLKELWLNGPAIERFGDALDKALVEAGGEARWMVPRKKAKPTPKADAPR